MQFQEQWSKFFVILSTINNYVFDCQYNKIKIKFVALINDCYRYSLDERSKLAFSMEYFVQCYKRVLVRRDHLTLNGNRDDLVGIFGIFLCNYVNLDFESVLLMHYKFNSVIKLPFTEIEPKIENENLIKLFQSYCLDTNNKNKETNLKKELDSFVLSKEYTYGSTKEKMTDIINEAFKYLLNIGVNNTLSNKKKPHNNVRLN